MEQGNGPVARVAAIATEGFVVLPADMPAGAAAARLAAAPPDATQAACVTGGDGTFLGTVTLATLVSSPAEAPVGPLAGRDGPVATPADTASGAALSLVAAGAAILPVVDGTGRLLSAVTAATAARFLVEEIEEDREIFSGLSGEREADDYLEISVLSDFRRRVPWVLGLAVAGLAAGYVVHVYEHALDALVILALYMPMVADTGGNVGTQAAGLATRAVALGNVRLADAGRVVWREARVAALLAAVLFAFAWAKVMFISNAADVPSDLTLAGIGTAIGVALAVQTVTATLIGALLPLGALAARQDPALVSGPALTTIVDFTGFLLYFVITTTLLGIPFAHG